MTRSMVIFLCILLVNTLLSVLYLVIGLLYFRRRETKEAEEVTGLDEIKAAMGADGENAAGDGETLEDSDAEPSGKSPARNGAAASGRAKAGGAAEKKPARAGDEWGADVEDDGDAEAWASGTGSAKAGAGNTAAGAGAGAAAGSGTVAASGVTSGAREGATVGIAAAGSAAVAAGAGAAEAEGGKAAEGGAAAGSTAAGGAASGGGENASGRADLRAVRESLNVEDEKEPPPPEEEIPMHDGKIVYVIRFLIMLFCPIVGPVFFGLGHFLFLFVFRKDVSLEDVVFSKERVRTNDRADEERERNIAPLEEAIAVSDKESLRSLMLNVIRGDVQNSLAAIALALNSQDSETSHYAASVLQDELNNFRGNVQKVRREIEKEEEDETDCEYYLIPYMNNVLEQKVFTEMEQNNMVRIFDEVGETLYRKGRQRFTSQYYEWLCLRLLDVRDFDRMEVWCNRAADQYPEELSSYTTKLKLYFTAQDKDKFFETLDALKRSSIVIDRETLALIRTFS